MLLTVKRGQRRLATLKGRCDVLRVRVGGEWNYEPKYVSAWREELSALTWAIEHIERDAAEGEERK